MTKFYSLYLGDAVYASLEADGSIRLSTNSHLETDAADNIILEPEVMQALIEFKDRAYQRLQEGQANEQ